MKKKRLAPIRVSDRELEILIEASDDRKTIQLSFGPGWAAIDPIPSNMWALRLLEELRNPVAI